MIASIPARPKRTRLCAAKAFNALSAAGDASTRIRSSLSISVTGRASHTQP
ncbi:hypothetical protein MOP88_08300 [Sphingomonas sp. WKB10]|nr:hypothetical protein [Sphingomonas sp. WKB10]